MSFHKQLVLNRWMYGFFRGGSLRKKAKVLVETSALKKLTGEQRLQIALISAGRKPAC